MPDVDELARTAFAAYSRSTGGLSVHGEQLPGWDELGAEIRNAWRAATRAIVERAAGHDVPD